MKTLTVKTDLGTFTGDHPNHKADRYAFILVAAGASATWLNELEADTRERTVGLIADYRDQLAGVKPLDFLGTKYVADALQGAERRLADIANGQYRARHDRPQVIGWFKTLDGARKAATTHRQVVEGFVRDVRVYALDGMVQS